MAKRDTGDVFGCLEDIMHHTEELKIKQMLICGWFTPEYLTYRFKMVRDDCKTVSDQLTLVKKALEEGDVKKALSLLEDKTLPHGHDKQD
jgi:hypothetical protein